MLEASRFEKKIYAFVNVITDHLTRIQNYTKYRTIYTKLKQFNCMYLFFMNITLH